MWSAESGFQNQKIKVIAYSGYRGEEIPRSFVLHGVEIKVVEILRMWLEEGLTGRATKRFYEIKGSDGKTHRIHYDEQAMEWFCRSED